MRSVRRRLSPRMEHLEGRELLSTGSPVLTMNRLDGIVGQLEKIAGRVTRTHDTTQASAAIARLASRTPIGSGPLVATWQNDLQSGSTLSRTALRNELAGALYNDVLNDVAAGTLRVTGPGSLVFQVLSPTPAPGEGSGGGGGSAPTAGNISVNVTNSFGQTLWVQLYYTDGSGMAAGPQAVGNQSSFTPSGSNSSLWIKIWTTSSTNLPPAYNGSLFYSGYQMNGGSITIGKLGNSFNISANPGS